MHDGGGDAGGHPDWQAHYRVLFDRHPDAVYQLDRDGRFTSGNGGLAALSGVDVGEMIGLRYARILHPEDVDRVASEFAKVLAGDVVTYETRVVHRDGSVSTLAVTNLPVEVDGEVVCVYGIARDITERQRAVRALEESERRFRGLFEHAAAGMGVATLEGRFVDANRALLEMLGYTFEEFRGLDVASITHPDDRAATAEKLGPIFAGEIQATVLERRYLTKAGEVRHGRTSVSLVRDSDGEPIHVLAIVEDVTASKLAAAEIRRAQALTQVAGRIAKVGGWALEPSGELYHSPEANQIIDATDEPGQRPVDAGRLYAPHDLEQIRTAMSACMSEGTPFDLSFPIETFAGRRIRVRITAEAQRGEDGRIERVVGALQDITELTAATNRTVELAERLSATFESMTDAVLLLDRSWRVTYANERAATVLGHPVDELSGRVLWEALPALAGTAVERLCREAVESRESRHIQEYHFPPSDFWLDVVVYPWHDGVSLYVSDVTAAHAAREELRAKEAAVQRQAELLDEAQDAIVVRDLEHRVTFWNRSAERIFGWSAEEALGRDVRILFGDDMSAVDAAMAHVRKHGSWHGELTKSTREGEVVIADSRWALLTDKDGRPDAVLSIETDVTREKAIERQLLRAQRMESIGTLAGGIAHDLNNVLAPILMAADLLEFSDSQEERSELLETVRRSASRGSDLVRQVLSFARGVEGTHRPTDLAVVLDDVCSIVRDTFPKDIDFGIDVSDELWPTVGDSTQIQQVVLNLAVNARDAMPRGGHLTISARNCCLEEHDARGHGLAAGDYVTIEVTDDGAGMPPHMLDRIFEPFFTTKPMGAGTGLGLSTSVAIARSHGGALTVESEAGRGSRFALYLPAAATRSHDDGSAAAGTASRGHGETILVVDDDDQVRTMTRRMLERYGYRTIEARDGAEGLSMFATGHDRIDVVLTDMMMPKMDGPSMIRAIREIDPDVAIIGMSGVDQSEKLTRAAEVGMQRFLAKPYSGARLQETVAELLDRTLSGSSPDG